MTKTDVEIERRRLSMPLEEALADEWGKGIAELRGGDASKPFEGDALVHLHDQLLGGINYVRQIGRSDERTARMLHGLGVEPKLVDLVYTIRSVYQARENHRDRTEPEGIDLTRKPN